MSFELRDLQEAGERYSWHYEDWLSLVWKTRKYEPSRRLDEAIKFLGKWNALRFKGGGDRLREVYPKWLKANRAILGKLERRPLYSLNSADFYSILYLTTSMWEKGIPPTTYGKLLHFLLPETVLLWDQKVVRTCYALHDDPCSFLSYQCFGWRLLHHISRMEGVSPLGKLEKSHAKLAGYYEPVTRILDHLAYRPQIARRAVTALGGSARAFSLELPVPS